jgi:hypothetical protein
MVAKLQLFLMGMKSNTMNWRFYVPRLLTHAP